MGGKKSKRIGVKLEVKDIGPLSTLDFSDELGSLKVAIYADNGQGKTFLSRILRLSESLPEAGNEVTDSYISKGASTGSMVLGLSDLKDSTSGSKQVRFDIRQGHTPKVQDNTDYIFHVFNSDYVRENLEASHYSPRGEIEGFILGRSNIDLSDEKRKLRDLDNDRAKLIKTLEKSLETAKGELTEAGVRQTTTEFKHITFERLFTNDEDSDNETFSEIRDSYERIKSLPEDTANVVLPDLTLDFDIAQSIDDVLGKSHQKSTIPPEIRTRIMNKLQFIEEGLNHLHSGEDGETCPFCEQQLQRNAHELIAYYEKYFEDPEGKIASEINDIRARLKNLKSRASEYEVACVKAESKFENLKSYFPSQRNVSLKLATDWEAFEESVDHLDEMLAKKAEDIQRSYQEHSTRISGIMSSIEGARAEREENERIVRSLNHLKSQTNTEKLQLRKGMCRARFRELKRREKSNIQQLLELNDRIRKLSDEIETKESSVRRSKRVAVAESFRHFLRCFFGDKYLFDADNFVLTFKNEPLEGQAPKVLSDGEKNIVAFCFFLAETHTRVDHDTDYKDLFWVVDDPISSMDFRYVYAMAELFRGLPDEFGIERVRLLVLTHSMEFMSILVRNRIIPHAYLLDSTGLSPLREGLVMPYEQHLRDINRIAHGDERPTHQTPNSLRHVLETINHFEDPSRDLTTMFKRSDTLRSDSTLYTLIQDGSHGMIRNERPFTDEMLITGCNTTLAYINERFPGQTRRFRKP